LTKDAVKVAVAEEDSPRAVSSHQRIFFAEMGSITGHDGQPASAAVTLFLMQPVHPAEPWANGAFAQPAARPGYFLCQPPVPVGLQICWKQRILLVFFSCIW
jgi:hypothetical protein